MPIRNATAIERYRERKRSRNAHVNEAIAMATAALAESGLTDIGDDIEQAISYLQVAKEHNDYLIALTKEYGDVYLPERKA